MKKLWKKIKNWFKKLNDCECKCHCKGRCAAWHDCREPEDKNQKK